MKLDVVLRTCDTAVVHTDWRRRYCEIPKNKLVIGCVTSLVNAIEKTSPEISVHLTVLDDHSTTDTLVKVQQIISRVSSTFISLPNSGYNNSALEQCILCRDSNADLVYAIEDDYLHCPSSITEMVESYKIFVDRLKHDRIVVYPFDEPSEYNPPARPDFIVHGSHRHWRTGVFTTQVLMSSPEMFRTHWDLFETLATKYNGDYLNPRTEHYEESNTIWNIWKNGNYVRFNPIPSLALHMQFEQQKDPFIDWTQWWDDYAK